MMFNRAVILTHYNCICILFLTALNMATLMAEICQLITRLLIFLNNFIHQTQYLTYTALHFSFSHCYDCSRFIEVYLLIIVLILMQMND